jgi:hypothetical protein
VPFLWRISKKSECFKFRNTTSYHRNKYIKEKKNIKKQKNAAIELLRKKEKKEK